MSNSTRPSSRALRDRLELLPRNLDDHGDTADAVRPPERRGADVEGQVALFDALADELGELKLLLGLIHVGVRGRWGQPRRRRGDLDSRAAHIDRQVDDVRVAAVAPVRDHVVGARALGELAHRRGKVVGIPGHGAVGPVGEVVEPLASAAPAAELVGSDRRAQARRIEGVNHGIRRAELIERLGQRVAHAAAAEPLVAAHFERLHVLHRLRVLGELVECLPRQHPIVETAREEHDVLAASCRLHHRPEPLDLVDESDHHLAIATEIVALRLLEGGAHRLENLGDPFVDLFGAGDVIGEELDLRGERLDREARRVDDLPGIGKSQIADRLDDLTPVRREGRDELETADVAVRCDADEIARVRVLADEDVGRVASAQDSLTGREAEIEEQQELPPPGRRDEDLFAALEVLTKIDLVHSNDVPVASLHLEREVVGGQARDELPLIVADGDLQLHDLDGGLEEHPLHFVGVLLRAGGRACGRARGNCRRENEREEELRRRTEGETVTHGETSAGIGAGVRPPDGRSTRMGHDTAVAVLLQRLAPAERLRIRCVYRI